MFKSISKRNIRMIVQNATLAMTLVCGFSLSSKAEDIKTYEILQISCNPFAQDSINLQCNSNSTVEPESTTIAQTRRGRRRKSKVQNYYGGFSLGVGFPSGEITLPSEETEIEFGTGFAGSVFGGVKLNKNFGAELEFALGLGNADTDDFNQSINNELNSLRELAAAIPDTVSVDGDFEADADYSTFALYISPRFDLPISERFGVFVSPGIGLSQTNVNYEVDSDASVNRTGSSGDPELDAEFDQTAAEFNNLFEELNTDRDSSRTGVSFQIKAGASYQISNTIGIFGQVRYVTLPTESNDEFETDNLNAFSTQAGLTFNF